ncbi:hypothetical protein BSFA1_78090 (plasmid) [Burkholderia sp. SFA1]|nr:catalase [Burkholderia sp. RPE67]BBQ02681.1 hypothetical protein BSFA1_78090 [Burkholderia sp. SFA1]
MGGGVHRHDDELTADMCSNIAAEARAKIVYERLINVTYDPGIKEALGFFMTREFTSVYFNMSKGDDMRGPWNEGGDWRFIEGAQPAVDGGDGLATVNVSEADVKTLESMAARTASDPMARPLTCGRRRDRHPRRQRQCRATRRSLNGRVTMSIFSTILGKISARSSSRVDFAQLHAADVRHAGASSAGLKCMSSAGRAHCVWRRAGADGYDAGSGG